MPPPNDGNEYLPFADLMRVERLDDLTFKSIALPYSPGGDIGLPRAYGGHIYAQAAWAACHTVKPGFLIYNVAGFFHSAASRTTPFIYTIRPIRDGRSYCTRDVICTVQGEKDPCFTSTISFKKPEPSILSLQPTLDLWSEYAAALQGKKPSDFEEPPGVDAPWYRKRRKETGKNDKFPGMETKKVDMDPYNNPRHPIDRRGIIFHRPIGNLGQDPNLHLVAHLYASDRNSLYIITNHLEVGDLWTYMGSLVHSVSFHGGMEDLLFGPSEAEKQPMDDCGDRGRWFAKEDFTLRVESGRAMLQGRIWGAGGKLVASYTQDGMIRFAKKPVATREELERLEEKVRGWPGKETKGKL